VIDIKRILCPIDFSEHSGHALDYAVALASWYEASVTALHVYTDWPAIGMVPSIAGDVPPPVRFTAIDHEVLLQHLRTFVSPHAKQGVPIDYTVQESQHVYQEVLVQADALHVDLMVLGTHGRSGFEHLLLGSITEKVVRKATCPVMVVPRCAGDATPEHVVHVRQVLCPVDFSSGSLAALTHAVSLAEEADAHLTLLYVEEMPPELAEHPAFGDIDVDTIRAEARAERLRRLRGLVPESAKTFCTVDTVVSDGRASRAILRLAAERKSDLIVMGVQGRGAIDMALFGSNTHEVMRAATCPVLTIRGR
jgi:nucleotide-binding universal stress UspA family protein